MGRHPAHDTAEFLRPFSKQRALTVVETLVSLALIAVLFSILVPALTSARVASHRDQCQVNQGSIGEAWMTFLADHNQRFPHVPIQPGWTYGGMRFSSVDGGAFPDLDRPLSGYMGLERTHQEDDVVCCCPADAGLIDPTTRAGTGRRTVYRSFGTSYRANGKLLDMRQLDPANEARGMYRNEITTPPSRMILMGDPVWYEVAEATGRRADWHGHDSAGNILYLDGSVRFLTIKPRADQNQPSVFDPMMPGSVPLTSGPVEPASMPGSPTPESHD
jgi:prepilin-type processing-associated H-X9-DG protein